MPVVIQSRDVNRGSPPSPKPLTHDASTTWCLPFILSTKIGQKSQRDLILFPFLTRFLIYSVMRKAPRKDVSDVFECSKCKFQNQDPSAQSALPLYTCHLYKFIYLCFSPSCWTLLFLLMTEPYPSEEFHNHLERGLTRFLRPVIQGIVL